MLYIQSTGHRHIAHSPKDKPALSIRGSQRNIRSLHMQEQMFASEYNTTSTAQQSQVSIRLLRRHVAKWSRHFAPKQEGPVEATFYPPCFRVSLQR
jgi:hypothetical protein